MTIDNIKQTDNPPTLSNSRPLADLEEEFAATLKNDLPNVIRRGELLIEIKAALGRGKWLPWLAEKFSLSASTAQNYMNAARFAEKYPTVRDLKIGPGVLYWLMAREDDFAGDKLNAVFALEKGRWIGIEEASRAVASVRDGDGQHADGKLTGPPARVVKSGTLAGAEKPAHSSSTTGNALDDPQASADKRKAEYASLFPDTRVVEYAPSSVPEIEEPAERAVSEPSIPQGVGAQLDGFDIAMRQMLKC